ncbi:MAG: ABC transporter permease [Thermosynechococcaceae cyanobacterium]
MAQFLLRRLLRLIPVLFGITFIAFAVLEFIPGDPATVMLGERATPDQVAALREQLGLNQPLGVQYAHFLGRLVQGDFGQSIVSGIAIQTEFIARWPATCELAIAAMTLALGLGIPAGVVAAVYANRWPDRLLRVGALLGVSIPVYWLGLLLIYLFAVSLHWLPASDRLSTDLSLTFTPLTGLYLVDSVLQGNGVVLGDAIAHLLLPALTLGSIPLAVIARITRSAMLEALAQNYIRTAKAKGVPPLAIVGRHALKNALIPVSTVAGLQFGTLLGGAILTETIFAWPGIGAWLYEGILNRDYPVVQSGIVVVATIFVLLNLLTDWVYHWIDPRIRT